MKNGPIVTGDIPRSLGFADRLSFLLFASAQVVWQRVGGASLIVVQDNRRSPSARAIRSGICLELSAQAQRLWPTRRWSAAR